MTPEDVKKLEDFALTRLKGERTRRLVKRLATWSVVAVVSVTIFSFIIDGTELFTQRLPALSAILSLKIMLGQTFRSILVKELIYDDLSYDSRYICIVSHQLLDLENTGDPSDLLIVLARSPDAGSPGQCGQDFPADQLFYVLLKEIEWKRIWPKYALVSLIRQLELPVIFEGQGPFLVGTTYGTSSAGYIVFGYAHGVLHQYGRYFELGAREGVQVEGSTAHFSYLGKQLFIQTDDGFLNFVITPNGTFEEHRMSSQDIVDQFNAAVVIADTGTLAANGCSTVTAGGENVTLVTSSKQSDSQCVGTITIDPEDVIVTDAIACEYIGLRQTKQFPWGYVFDGSQKAHYFSCPLSDRDKQFDYRINVELNKAE